MPIRFPLRRVGKDGEAVSFKFEIEVETTVNRILKDRGLKIVDRENTCPPDRTEYLVRFNKVWAEGMWCMGKLEDGTHIHIYYNDFYQHGKHILELDEVRLELPQPPEEGVGKEVK